MSKDGEGASSSAGPGGGSRGAPSSTHVLLRQRSFAPPYRYLPLRRNRISRLVFLANEDSKPEGVSSFSPFKLAQAHLFSQTGSHPIFPPPSASCRRSLFPHIFSPPFSRRLFRLSSSRRLNFLLTRFSNRPSVPRRHYRCERSQAPLFSPSSSSSCRRFLRPSFADDSHNSFRYNVHCLTSRSRIPRGEAPASIPHRSATTRPTPSGGREGKGARTSRTGEGG